MRVAIVQRTLPHYRVPFFEGLRVELAAHGVQLDLMHGRPRGDELLRADTRALSWAVELEDRSVSLASTEALWQPVLGHARHCDLIIVEQASRLISNYALLASRRVLGCRVGFWGHGRNFQAPSTQTPSERLKRIVSTWPDWWFAYTDGSARIVEALGYPPERTTVVQNAVDTRALRRARSEVDTPSSARLRARLGVHGHHVGIFCGSLYAAKRPEFLLEACRHVRRCVPDFELIVIGSGPDAPLVRAVASDTPWIHYVGPVHGPERAQYFALADVMLLPGLVGLNVLDAFAMEVPLVTVDASGHGPEIEYLVDGANGIIAPSEASSEEFARVVAALLNDTSRLKTLKEGCKAAASRYTVEEMVSRFARGVLTALA